MTPDTGFLISADSHVTIPLDAWATYLDPDFRDRAPRLEVSDGEIVRVFEGRRKPIRPSEVLGSLANVKPEQYGSTTDYVAALRAERSPASDPVCRLEDQDVDHVAAEVLYMGGPLLEATDGRLRLHSYRAYNRWLWDFCSHAPDRLIGAAAVPYEDPDHAVDELRAALDMGFRTAYLPLFPKSGSFSEPAWDPLWSLAEEAGVPIGLHISQLRHVERTYDDPGIYMTENMMCRLIMAEALSELIQGAVLQRHPELRIVSVEAEIGWIPWFLERLDHNWHRHRHWIKSEVVEEPSQFFHRQVSATFTKDFAGIRQLPDIGIDNVMWSNDYPHAESNWPNSKKLADEWLEGYDDSVRAKLMWQNAARLYDLTPPTA